MSTNYGHYGLPAMRSAIAVGVAVLAHLILPFGVVEYRGPAAPKPWVVRFFEASDTYASAPDILTPIGSSIGLLLLGLALAALGVTILMVLGYQPLRVDGARWFGATGGFLTVLGAAIALTPSMYHVGTGFSTFMGTVLFTEFRAQYWAVSPVVVAGAMLYAIHNGLQVMVKVTTSRDGIRDGAQRQADIVRYAAVLLCVVLFVPWSIGLLPDGVSDALNYPVGDEAAPLFFSAQDVSGATLAELAPAGHLRYGRDSDWHWTGLAIGLIVGAAWSAIVIGAGSTLIATGRSTGWPAGIERTMRLLYIPAGLLWVGAGLLYLASWVLCAPRSGLDVTFLPGFWPILVPVAAWFVLRRQMVEMKPVEPDATAAVAS